jgi:hypothetical protein
LKVGHVEFVDEPFVTVTVSVVVMYDTTVIVVVPLKRVMVTVVAWVVLPGEVTPGVVLLVAVATSEVVPLVFGECKLGT